MPQEPSLPRAEQPGAPAPGILRRSWRHAMGGQALFRDDLSKGAPLSSEPLRSCLLEAHHQEAFPGAAGKRSLPHATAGPNAWAWLCPA